MTEAKTKRSYTQADEDSFVAAYIAAEKIKPISTLAWCKAGYERPNHQTLDKWLIKAGHTKAKLKKSAVVPAAKAIPTPTTLEGVKAAIAGHKAALVELEESYITLLRKEAEDLKAAYEAAQQELLDYETTPKQSPAEHYANMTKVPDLD